MMKTDTSMLRQAMVEELKRRGITPYRLAQDQQGLHPETARSYFYEKGEAKTTTVETLMRELDLVVIPGKHLKLLKRLVRAAEKVNGGLRKRSVEKVLKELRAEGMSA